MLKVVMDLRLDLPAMEGSAMITSKRCNVALRASSFCHEICDRLTCGLPRC